jgi:hypothetical protein
MDILAGDLTSFKFLGGAVETRLKIRKYPRNRRSLGATTMCKYSIFGFSRGDYNEDDSIRTIFRRSCGSCNFGFCLRLFLVFRYPSPALMKNLNCSSILTASKIVSQISQVGQPQRFVARLASAFSFVTPHFPNLPPYLLPSCWHVLLPILFDVPSATYLGKELFLEDSARSDSFMWSLASKDPRTIKMPLLVTCFLG